LRILNCKLAFCCVVDIDVILLLRLML